MVLPGLLGLTLFEYSNFNNPEHTRAHNFRVILPRARNYGRKNIPLRINSVHIYILYYTTIVCTVCLFFFSLFFSTFFVIYFSIFYIGMLKRHNNACVYFSHSLYYMCNAFFFLTPLPQSFEHLIPADFTVLIL